MLMSLLIITCVKYTTSARILGIVPTPSYSHQVVFRSLWAELSLRGHEVVVITTDPMNNKTLTNLTEIDLHSAYRIWNKHDIINFVAKHQNENNFIKMMDKVSLTLTEVIDNQMNYPEVQELYNSTFDVVLTEMMFPSMCAFSRVYNCPCIGIMSMELSGLYHEPLGNPVHPVLYPDVFSTFYGKLQFMQRLISTIIYVCTQLFNSAYMKPQNEILQKHFKQFATSVNSLINNIDLALVNVNPILHRVRPVTPATILIGGGTHITDVKPLPQVCNDHLHFIKLSLLLLYLYLQSVQEILDTATDGVIYFSMGSNAKSKDLPSEVKKVLLNAFKELPFTVLWKYEDDELPGRSENVKIAKWLPQQDVLSKSVRTSKITTTKKIVN